MLIEIINNGLYEVFSERSSELTENPKMGELLKLIENERKQKETDTALQIDMLLNSKGLKEKIERLVRNENLKLPTGKEFSAVNLYLLLYNKYNKEAIPALLEGTTEEEKRILEQCYDLQETLKTQSKNVSQIIHDKLEKDSELKTKVLNAIQKVISTKGKWLPQQFIPAIARVSKTIISSDTGQEYIGVNTEESVIIHFITGVHYERVVPNDWTQPLLTPSIFAPKGEENYTKLAKNILAEYKKIDTTNNISIKNSTTANNTKFIRNNDKTVLGTLTPNGMEFPLISTTSQEKEVAIEPNEPKLIDEQQKLFISFLYSVKEDQTKEGKILTLEAKNFPPNSLKAVLNAIKETHSELLVSIKFKLPPLDKCCYISSIQEDGAFINQKYTPKEHDDINLLIQSITPPKSPHP